MKNTKTKYTNLRLASHRLMASVSSLRSSDKLESEPLTDANHLRWHQCFKNTNTNTNTPVPTIWDDISVSKIQRQRQRHRCQPSEMTSVFQTFSTGSVSYMWSRHCRAESRPAGSTTNKERTWIYVYSFFSVMGPARLYTTSGSSFQATPKSFQFKLWLTWSQEVVKDRLKRAETRG